MRLWDWRLVGVCGAVVCGAAGTCLAASDVDCCAVVALHLCRLLGMVLGWL